MTNALTLYNFLSLVFHHKSLQLYNFDKNNAGVDPTKLFFLRIFFFGIKLGHFTLNKFFSVCIKNASLPAKNGEILR